MYQSSGAQTENDQRPDGKVFFFSLFLRFSVVERREEEYDHDDLSK